MGLAVSTALPTIDCSSTPSVNSWKSILSESFCDIMKWRRLPPAGVVSGRAASSSST